MCRNATGDRPDKVEEDDDDEGDDNDNNDDDNDGDSDNSNIDLVITELGSLCTNRILKPKCGNEIDTIMTDTAMFDFLGYGKPLNPSE